MLFVLLLACMPVFESPPCLFTRMEREQTYNISSPDLREDALDDMMHHLCLQGEDPDYFEESERDQL